MIAFSVDGGCNTADKNLDAFFNTLGIPKNGETGIWYLNNKTGILYTANAALDSKEYFTVDKHDMCLSRTYNQETQSYINSIIFDNMDYKKVTNGVNVLVYNPLTKDLVGSFGINMDDNYNIVW